MAIIGDQHEFNSKIFLLRYYYAGPPMAQAYSLRWIHSLAKSWKNQKLEAKSEG